MSVPGEISLSTGRSGVTPRLWLLTVVVAAIVVCGSLGSASPALAQAPGACGSVLLSGGSWLNGGGVDVYSNGPDEGTGESCGGGDHYQCVELVNRLYQAKGWISGTWYGNGGRSSPGARDSLWDEAPGNLSKQANGSISYVGPGDEVSINLYDRSTFIEDGHALIVNNSTSVTSGTVDLVSQNSGDSSNANPQITATLSNGTLTIPNSGAWSYPVIGVVHAPGGGSTPPPPPTTQANLLADGGFQPGYGGWSTLPADGGTMNFTTYQNSSAHDGGSYAESNSSNGSGSIEQEVPVNMSAGQSATLSMWVRLAPGQSETGLTANVCLWSLGSSNANSCQQVVLTTQWQQGEATLTIPDATSNLLAQVYMPANVNVDFDGAVLSNDLLADGGFQPGYGGWSTLPADGGTMNFTTYQNSSAHDGGSYAESNSSNGSGSIEQEVPVNMSAGQSATLSMWVRLAPGQSETGLTANVCLWSLGSSNANSCQQVVLTTQWQQGEATLTIPDATSNLLAQVYMPANVNVDFDGAVLSNDLLADGGFQPGYGGWLTLPADGGTMNFTTYQNSSAHDGGSYAESNSSNGSGSIEQEVPVNMSAGQSATLSMWVRLAPGQSETGLTANVCLWSLGSSNANSCQQVVLTTQWQQGEATLTIPDATSNLLAQVYMPANVNVDFDGASLGAPQVADAVYVPVATANPTVTGDTAVGSTVTCAGGSWNGAPDQPTSYGYSWLLGSSPISGASGSTYTITSADAGQTLSCSITATNAAGSTAAGSNPTSVPAPTPPTATPPASPPPVTSTASSGTTPTNASPKGGVDASKATGSRPRLTSAELLAKALTGCRRINNRKKRAACDSTARRRYQHELQLARERQRAGAIAACKHVKNADKRKACVSAAERRHGSTPTS